MVIAALHSANGVPSYRSVLELRDRRRGDRGRPCIPCRAACREPDCGLAGVEMGKRPDQLLYKIAGFWPIDEAWLDWLRSIRSRCKPLGNRPRGVRGARTPGLPAIPRNAVEAVPRCRQTADSSTCESTAGLNSARRCLGGPKAAFARGRPRRLGLMLGESDNARRSVAPSV